MAWTLARHVAMRQPVQLGLHEGHQAIERLGVAREQHWWKYTDGAPSGTLTISAPAQPGQYEFRYLLDDGLVDTGRSSPVTVR